ncbi:hypothetical protein ACO22_06441 [Paracoccidioides brasiliensis]|uniref:Uncharacterized protein n=1 Tax=Paracoccidioides brasiliensis TaxID=121759 RepID=A0A1D2J7F5_PARBR|nr:hypothetical protein ACO22_06441 [Paracoccidioides brasiliensis]
MGEGVGGGEEGKGSGGQNWKIRKRPTKEGAGSKMSGSSTPNMELGEGRSPTTHSLTHTQTQKIQGGNKQSPRQTTVVVLIRGVALMVVPLDSKVARSGRGWMAALLGFGPGEISINNESSGSS